MNGAQLIAAERERQIAKEGWSARHDDTHEHGELTAASSAYLDTYLYGEESPFIAKTGGVPHIWPWDREAWKPSEDPIRNLVKAGALIAAEIDRLQRAQAPAAAPDLRA